MKDFPENALAENDNAFSDKISLLLQSITDLMDKSAVVHYRTRKLRECWDISTSAENREISPSKAAQNRTSKDIWNDSVSGPVFEDLKCGAIRSDQSVMTFSDTLTPTQVRFQDPREPASCKEPESFTQVEAEKSSPLKGRRSVIGGFASPRASAARSEGRKSIIGGFSSSRTSDVRPGMDSMTSFSSMTCKSRIGWDGDATGTIRSIALWGEHKEAEKLQSKKISRRSRSLKWLRNADNDTLLEVAVGCVICINALFVGASADLADGTLLWLLLDISFCLIFLFELIYKLRDAEHRRKFFRGPGFWLNYFDIVVVSLDVIQILLMAWMSTVGDFFELSILRLVRLIKIVRFVKLLKYDMFKDLVSMIQGLSGGMRTLLWSLLLFTFIVYVLSLMFREVYGRSTTPKANVTEYFNSVPRSMFTTFRCSFGDCDSKLGVPIFEHVHMHFGNLSIFLYCLYVFIVTVGLFNVISAIFVQSTLQAANKLDMVRQRQRLCDEKVWLSNIGVLLKKIVSRVDPTIDLDSMSSNAERVSVLEIPKTVIAEMAYVPEAVAALAALDIPVQEIDQLADMLDPDNGGTVLIFEFVEGLKCLRGEPRRSDIISVNFLIREALGMLDEMYTEMAGGAKGVFHAKSASGVSEPVVC